MVKIKYAIFIQKRLEVVWTLKKEVFSNDHLSISSTVLKQLDKRQKVPMMDLILNS